MIETYPLESAALWNKGSLYSVDNFYRLTHR
jgi:hypothetical protein